MASCSPHDFSHQHDGESQQEVVLREGRGDAGHFIGKDLLPGPAAWPASHGDTERPPLSLILNGHGEGPLTSCLPFLPPPALLLLLVLLACGQGRPGAETISPPALPSWCPLQPRPSSAHPLHLWAAAGSFPLRVSPVPPTLLPPY